MTDPFITLHWPDGTPFRIKAEGVETIEPVLAADGADPAARCQVNGERFVLETPDGVHAAVVAKLSEKGDK